MSGKPDLSAWWLALAGVIGAVAGALVTGAFNYLDHQRDLDAKMIELSVGILRSEPTPETTPLREWAVDVIEKRAQFKFNAEARATLLKKQLPFVGGTYYDDILVNPNVLRDPNILKRQPSPPQ
jgi:hypothetical protein